MNQIVNMNLVLEKELELERQGYRRTRRWIGDVKGTDARWYQRGVSRIVETKRYPGEVSRTNETKPRREARHSILDRLLHLLPTRRQPACNDC